MRVAIGISFCIAVLAGLLALDTGTQSYVLMKPRGFEAALVVPAFFYWLGALATVVAAILTAIHVTRQKQRFRTSATVWACAILIACYAGLWFVHP